MSKYRMKQLHMAERCVVTTLQQMSAQARKVAE